MSVPGMSELPLQPGEIKLEYIPDTWRVIPTDASKRPYIKGWQLSKYTTRDLPRLLEDPTAKGIGVIGGPVIGESYGLVWMDIDGPSVYEVVKHLASASLEDALKPTLTIKSGKEGRERRLYKVPKKCFEFFLKNKYTWHGDSVDEKLEILWTKTQGVLMGAHPDTAGYFTPPGLGFEWAADLPTLPQWLLEAVDEENCKREVRETTTRMVGPNFALNITRSVERELMEAKEALWAMHEKDPSAVNDYDIWVQIGMMLHSLDESALDIWEEWSKEGDSYKPGGCLAKWRSFNKGGGGVTIASLFHMAKERGWAGPSQNERAMPVGDEIIAALLEKTKEEEAMPDDVLENVFTPRGRGKTVREAIHDRDEYLSRKKEGKPQNLKPMPLAEELTKWFGGKLAHSDDHQAFFLWGGVNQEQPGLWQKLSDKTFQGIIIDGLKAIESHALPNSFGPAEIDHMKNLLVNTSIPLPKPPKDLLLFTNGYLDLKTREFSTKHNRELGFINIIPFEYNPALPPGKIPEWLAWTQYEENTPFEERQATRVLQAVLRMCLVGAPDLQRYVEIIGPGGTGKTTFASLCAALVGYKNITSSSFERMNNRFEAASWMGKKLLLLADQDAWGGSCAMLKALTGGDYIKAENKHQKEVREFKFDGHVIVTANQPMQSIDKTTGLARRRLFVSFDRVFKDKVNRQQMISYCNTTETYSGPWADQMSGLLAWVLSMSDQEMREYIIQPELHSNRIRKFTQQQRLAVNPVERFVNEQLVWDANGSCYLGSMHAKEKDADRYEFEKQDLYPAFLRFHIENGGSNKPMTKNNFKSILVSYLLDDLQMRDHVKFEEGRLYRPVDERTATKGQRQDVRFHNIALRCSNPQKYNIEYMALDEFARGLQHGE